MISNQALEKLAKLRSSATLEQIHQAQQEIGYIFPEDYIQLLSLSNGIQVIDVASLVLYSTDELRERNSTYEVPDYLPGWLMIGDDGGGQGIFLDCIEIVGAIYSVGMGSMLRTDAILLAGNLTQWIDRAFLVLY